MNIKLYRSENQKNVIVEIATEKSKILLDCGVTLEENEVLLLPELQKEYSFEGIDGVFITNYNSDHVTMARGLIADAPTYIGRLAGKMAAAAESYKSKKPFPFAGFYANAVPIIAGDITVTPFLVDDAVHEGYLLFIQGEGTSVIYAGDYHANGRKRFEEMLAGLPTKVDVLLCKGGVITKDDINPITERGVEEKISELIAKEKGPVFVLNAVNNFDRTTTLFNAAHRNKRVLLEDLYFSQIASAADRAMPNPKSWAGVRAYLTTGYKPEHFRYKMFTSLPRLSKAEIATQKFVMCIRPSMKKYMKTLFQEMRFSQGIIINALPDEAAKSAATEEYLAFAVEKGLKVHTLRTSGHADAMAIKALIEWTNPRKIMPLNSQEALWLASNYPNIEVEAKDILQL